MEDTITIFMLYKIQEEDFLIGGDKCRTPLSRGYVFFSCCGKWVDIGKAGCNSGQGDKYECVFAKYLKKNSRKPVQRYKKLFGPDLLLERDDEYVLLRRKSSLLVPTTCFYSIDSETSMTNLQAAQRQQIDKLTLDNREKTKIIVDNFPLVLTERYKKDFNLSSDKNNTLLILPGEFLPKLDDAGVGYRKVAYINTNCEYDIFKNEMYEAFYGKMSFDDAINKRIEIFFKDKEKYAHQCELRCVITNECERFTTHRKSKIIHLDGLSFFDSDSSETKDATGMDFIYGNKNGKTYAMMGMENQNYR